jgi:hypothetical protein
MLSKSPVDLSIIIPTHFRYPQIINTIKSIQTQDTKGIKLEVLIVSNFKDKKLQAHINNIKCDNTHYFYLEVGEIGVNKARNLGIKTSTSKTLYFLDDDVILKDENSIKNILTYSNINSDCIAFGGGYIYTKNAKLINKAYNHIATKWLTNNKLSIGYVQLVGGNLIYKIKNKNECYYFDENIIFGGSETELISRLNSSGKVKYDESLSVYHDCKLNYFDLIKKAIKQGNGKAFIENKDIHKIYTEKEIDLLEYQITSKYEKFFYSIYINTYKLFFETGYRHGKLLSTNKLSIKVLFKCFFYSLLEIQNENENRATSQNEIPYHLKKIPEPKLNEIFHWMKANVWGKVGGKAWGKFCYFIRWQLLPLLFFLVFCKIIIDRIGT